MSDRPLESMQNLAASAAIDPSLLSACIHCGLCLPACPTYLATGREMESPRGRIYLLNLLQKGELPPEDRLVEHIDTCLGCLGCQTACPSGVQYGKILDQARPLLAEKRPGPIRAMMRYAFSKILPDYPRLNLLGKLLRATQKTGLASLPQKVFLLKKLLGPLAEWQEFLPAVPPHKPLPKQSWMSGEKTGEVQLFSGCVMDVFYNDVNHACIRLLTAQRQVVKVPQQTCCGALAFHAGETDIAKDLAKQNIELLENVPGEIIVTAAGCGAMLKEYGELFHGDKEWEERAHAFSARVKDITEFLADHEFAVKSKPVRKKVAYHAACHLVHAQKIREAPVKLLKQVDSAVLVPLNEAENCCGSAGIYNLMHTELSLKVLDRKMENIDATAADVLVTTNPGCLLQIQKGLRDTNSPMRACHLVELLDEAFCTPDQ
jgi:glycolate oxidase iron-sulfur subunit